MQALKEQNYQVQQKKSLGLIEAIAVVIGVVIGSGIFFKPAKVFTDAGAPGLGILAWVVGGIITMAAGLTVAEIAAAIPKTGGLFAYLKELYGEKWAFLLGWVQTLVYIPGSMAALGIVFATQATAFVTLTDFQQKLLAVGVIGFLMIVNMLSTKFGGKLQSVATVAKLLPIFVLVIFGLLKGQAHNFTPIVSNASTTAGFGAAILGTLWAYDGWINVGNIAGEIENPGKNLPRAIIGGLLLVMVAYITLNVALINVLPVEEIMASKKAASDVAKVLFGEGGAAFISAGILISIFGALNGYILTGTRVPYAMAKERLLPYHEVLSKENEKYGTPVNAMVLTFVMTTIYVATGSFDILTELVVFVLWIFFTMAVAGVFILRKNFPHLHRPYEVPLFPIIPLIGIAGGVFILINTLLTNTTYALYGVVVTLVGLPVYKYLRKN
ncbi:MAG: amino acid permease [Caloramator sp.]|uniref:Serine/threonine exchange transporter, LAT family (TC 2.A.3.8.12) n=1 Tax=Caloramator proteoclasticus DSM 10124 TaxID=1121262 RepID=A0A1M4XEF0_9CLOT|nr:amino acid permease [Caloramator proteoclasticus]GIW49316.1 MAG: amino acid permease [Caloramator sp.]SHE91793.1 serine/threonine exchange transporter, LAT family (TC 2.A.3.8.12) [Caloramator proteoclasticus DSM 10124]